jgi:hypothetical protein
VAVADPADLAHAVLLKVADFVRKLPADQLHDLAEGTVKLELVPKGGRASAAPRQKAAARPEVSAERVRADLAAFGDTAAARQYIVDLGLPVPGLRALAKELGIAVPSKATKEPVLQAIVQWTVGRRLDSETISRPAPSYG